VNRVTIYAPEPKRRSIKIFNIETQTYEGTVEFLLQATLKADAAAGPAELAAAMRYNVCDATRCLPPAKRTATGSVNVDPKASASAIAIPAGFSEFKPGAPVAAGCAIRAQAGSAGDRTLFAAGLWRGIARDLHAVRVSDDSDYDVVLLNKPVPASRREGVFPGRLVLPRHCRVVFRDRISDDYAAGAVRRGAARVESLGQRIPLPAYF